MTDLHRLRFVAVADVYKAGRPATGRARAASAVDRKALPFAGSPLTRTAGELRHRRGQRDL